MTFGQGQAQNFIIPMPQQQAAPAGGGGRPAGPAKEPDFDFKDYGLADPQFDLQATDNVGDAVTQYYQDYANAKRFAKTMWKQHGIDVLAPSGDNEFSVIASNTFNKMIANLWDTYNKAKQGASELSKAAEDQRAGQGFINQQAMQQGRFFSQSTPDQQFTSTQVPEYIRTAQQNISRTVDNPADFNRLTRDKQLVVEQAQRIFDANPTEQNRIALETAKTMSPVRNYERTGGSGSGDGGVRNAIEDVALYLSGSSKFFKPTGRRDSQGFQILETDYLKNRVIGTYEQRDPTTGAVKGTKPFVVHRSEYIPSLGKVVAYNLEGEPLTLEMGPVELGVKLGNFTSNRAYDELENMGVTDAADKLAFVRPENRATLPSMDELGSGREQALQQRSQEAQTIQQGITQPTLFSAFMSTTPLGGLVPDFLKTTQKDVTLTSPAGVKVTAKRKETDDGVKVVLDKKDVDKLFGTGRNFVVYEGQQYPLTQFTKEGIPVEMFQRLMEERGFTPGIPANKIQGNVR